MLTINLDPVDVVVRQSIKAGRQWFQRVGRFLSEHSDDPIALVVPSVIVPEYNVILYPRPVNFEPEFVRVQSIESFDFDPRLFERTPA